MTEANNSTPLSFEAPSVEPQGMSINPAYPGQNLPGTLDEVVKNFKEHNEQKLTTLNNLKEQNGSNQTSNEGSVNPDLSAKTPESPKEGDKETPGSKAESVRTLTRTLDAKSRQIDEISQKLNDTTLSLTEKERVLAEKLEEVESLRVERDRLAAEASKNTQYKELFELESDPAYQERYVATPQNIVQGMYNYAEQYGVDKVVVDAILTEPDLRKRNKYLNDNFKDIAAITQLIPQVEQFRNLMAEKARTDAKPIENRKALRAQMEQERVLQTKKGQEAFDATTTVAWNNTLENYENYELTRPYFKPEASDATGALRASEIKEWAKDIYDGLVVGLKQNGLASLSSDQAAILAALSQKGAAFDSMVKDLAAERAERVEMQKTIDKLGSLKPRGSSGQGHRAEPSPTSLDTSKGIPTQASILNRITQLSGQK